MAGYGYPNHPFLPNHQQPPLHHPQPTAPYGHNMLNHTSNNSFSFPTSSPHLWSPPMAHPLPPVPPVPVNNNNSSNLFYKTRPCKKYRETGECPYGKSCIFAHGDEELRKPPGKSGLCHKFMREGYCPNGNTCTYLHQQPAGKLNAAAPANWAIGGGHGPSNYQTSAPVSDPPLHYNHHHHHPITGADVAPTETEVEENMGGDGHMENNQRNIAAEEALRTLPNSTVSSTMDVYATPRNEENNNERNRDAERNKRFPRGKINTIYADWIDEC